MERQEKEDKTKENTKVVCTPSQVVQTSTKPPSKKADKILNQPFLICFETTKY